MSWNFGFKFDLVVISLFLVGKGDFVLDRYGMWINSRYQFIQKCSAKQNPETILTVIGTDFIIFLGCCL